MSRTVDAQISATKTGRRRTRRPVWFYVTEVFLWGFLIVFALIEIAPISWMFATSLRDPADSFNLPPDFWPTAFHWENYWAVITSPDINFFLFFWNSLKIATIITVAQLFTCSLAGFAFARLRFPGRNFLFFTFLGTCLYVYYEKMPDPAVSGSDCAGTF